MKPEAIYDLASKKVSATIGNATNNVNNVLLALPTNPTQGVNLYNPATAVSGSYISAVNGTLQSSASYYASDYVPVKAMTSYTRLNDVHIAYYDSNKVYISGAQSSGFLFTTPANCAFVRVSILVAKYATEQIMEVIPSQSIVPSISFRSGKNLYNPGAAIPGYYINEVNNGLLQVNPSYYATEWIPVKPLTTYVGYNSPHMAFYDANQRFISGLTSGSKFTTPANCYYIRESISLASINTQIQIEEGSVVTTYEPYKFTPNTVPLSTYSDIKLAVAPVIPAVVGRELNIYFENIMCVDNINNYQIDVACTKGIQQNERWTFIPVTNPTTAPTLSTSTTGGSLTAATYYVKYTWVNAQGQQTQGSSEASITTTGTTSTITVTVPALPNGVVSANIYISTSTGAETKQGSTTSTTYTQSAALTSGAALPTSNAIGDVGDTAMTISVYQKFNLVAMVNTTIRVSATGKGTGQTLKVNIIGDSTTANNVMISELANVLSGDPLTITFIGTKGVSPKFHEGVSGSTTNYHYTDPASSFVYGGAFDYAQYLSTKALATPDIVVINLGINDMFAFTDDASALNAIYTMISQYDAIMANIKISNVNMKFAIGVTVPSGNQDAFGNSYGAGQTSWRYKMNHRMLAKVLVDYYGGREASNIYLLPINTNLDIVNNMEPAAAVPINSRNPATVVRQTNGVHPGNYGYYQIADTYYSWLKSIAT